MRHNMTPVYAHALSHIVTRTIYCLLNTGRRVARSQHKDKIECDIILSYSAPHKLDMTQTYGSLGLITYLFAEDGVLLSKPIIGTN